MAETGPLAGAVVELEVGAPAHGGACVARYEGRVVFVRHALPGELVRARVSEDRGGAYCRAEAVQVLRASPQRVVPPCPHAGPGRCGGCDWQHASAPAQRELKAAVVIEQFARVAGLDVADLLGEVRELPGGLLGWRTRITYAVGADGRPGLHRFRSAEVEPLEACPLGVPAVGQSPVLARHWPGLTGVEVVTGTGRSGTGRSGTGRSGTGRSGTGQDEPTVLGHRPGPGRQARGRRPPDRVELLSGPARVRHAVGGREFSVAASGFWQVHPHAAAEFTAAVLQALSPRPGEKVLELYCGAGALTAALADAVGPGGHVLGVEAAAEAVRDAGDNLVTVPWARVRRGRVDATLLRGLDLRPDLVVLDPPRSGAGRETMAAVLQLRPRAVGYVACDPAALARDVRAARDLGWRLDSLVAFDAFPMTHHVECVAGLRPPGPEPG